MTAPVPARIQGALNVLQNAVADELRAGAEATRTTLDMARDELRRMQETVDSAEAAVETARPRLLRILTEILARTDLHPDADERLGTSGDVIERVGRLVSVYADAQARLGEFERRLAIAVRHADESDQRADRWRDQYVETEQRRKEHVERCEETESDLRTQLETSDVLLREQRNEIATLQGVIRDKFAPVAFEQGWNRLDDGKYHHIAETPDGGRYLDGRLVGGSVYRHMWPLRERPGSESIVFMPAPPELPPNVRLVVNDRRWWLVNDRRWWLEEHA